MKLLTDFQICIGVPLRVEKAKKPLISQKSSIIDSYSTGF